MKKIVLLIILLLYFSFANITNDFPQLTGRVIDKANILSPQAIQNLSEILQKEEKKSSNQIVVVILKSLNGYEINDYSYQLGRFWKIGQKDKNNGVLLLISMEDRKLRIEVGYGLEGALTDKISYEIIEYTLSPAFKRKEYEKGIFKAVEQIILATKGEFVSEKKQLNRTSEDFSPFIFFIFIFFSMFFTGFSAKAKNLFFYKVSKSTMLSSFFGFFTYMVSQEFTQYGLIASTIIFIIVFIFNFKYTKKIDKINSKGSSLGYAGSSTEFGNGYFGDGFSSSGGFSSGGGFSGGGGSFGGGGASGSW